MSEIKLPKYIRLAPNSHGKETIKKYMGVFSYKNTLYSCGTHETIKQAQIAVDMKRIGLGLKPILLKKLKPREV